MEASIVSFEQWLKTVPEVVSNDPIWRMSAYRYALFFSDLVWRDATKLLGDKRTISVADQLLRASGSIHANLTEGYAYSTGGNRAKYYEYALGSARESRDWYWEARHILGDEVYQHRTNYLTQIISLLVTSIPTQRVTSLRETNAEYKTNSTINSDTISTEILFLLENIPFA
ncbi:MAG TPA: four helix bundle protein [Thermoflexales bacterium]|nr:four helix bundle protein [Thermoflexales bacterium]HQW34657.1 four helix bundle protein [Thermoflexales bacterium]HQZ21108.1 four helix bundle protein [Thermoflexales bacterium]HRA00796.1 four helix bundle protein [Thermoflexales bacterium]